MSWQRLNNLSKTLAQTSSPGQWDVVLVEMSAVPSSESQMLLMVR